MRQTVVAEYLQEREARPRDVYARLRGLAIESAQVLLEGKAALVDVACPACTSVGEDEAFVRHGYRYLECTDCGTLYISPRPTAEAMQWYWLQSPLAQFRRSETFRDELGEHVHELIQGRADWIVSLCHASGLPASLAIVDVEERYSAVVTSAARRISGTVYAVRPLWAVGALNGVESAATVDGLDKLGSDSAQVVTAFDVLEHTADLAGLVAGVHRVLAPGGLFALTTRAGSGFDIQALWEHTDTIFPLEHVNLISVRGIRTLLERTGFDLVELSTPGQLDVQVVARALSGDLAGQVTGERVLRRLVLDSDEDGRRDLQQFLQKHLLSSHMRVVARKRTNQG